MEYSEMERIISDYNDHVRAVNSLIDNEIKNNEITDIPYGSFELLKANDENKDHVPYLYFRFVHLPYDSGDSK